MTLAQRKLSDKIYGAKSMDYIPRRVLESLFARLPKAALRDRLCAMRALADAHGVRYVDDEGRRRIIDIALKPWVLTSLQLRTFQRMIHQLVRALARLPHLYATYPALRQVISFSSEQEAWLRLRPTTQDTPLAVIGRLDASVAYDQAGWRSSLKMLEPNAVGVGGIHYAPTACGILMEVIGDQLRRVLSGRTISPSPDPRDLLFEELQAVAKRLHRRLRAVALIENRDYTTGTDEFSSLAEDIESRGLKAIVADPRDLRLVRGEVRFGSTRVDLLYRDSELSEFIEMESTGRRLSALREAVRRGQLISSLKWEFDQKSAWEIFTDETYARCFSPSQRRCFREHLLWTRLVREAQVTNPTGCVVDLPRFIRRHKDRLVLKPTSLFGGEGVVIGAGVSQQQWESQLMRALNGKQRYVVQTLAQLPREQTPRLIDGKVQMASCRAVSGFFFNSSRIGLVGRFSSKPVVNVSQGGGLIGALWVH